LYLTIFSLAKPSKLINVPLIIVGAGFTPARKAIQI